MTNGVSEDSDQAFAAGYIEVCISSISRPLTFSISLSFYSSHIFFCISNSILKGALTTSLIYSSWMTSLEYFYNGAFNTLAAAWLQKNDEWVRAQVTKCASLQSMLSLPTTLLSSGLLSSPPLSFALLLTLKCRRG